MEAHLENQKFHQSAAVSFVLLNLALCQAKSSIGEGKQLL